MIEIIDTNVILRFLVGDDKSLFDSAEKIFKEVQDGKRKVLVKVVVVAETCFVLESFYKKSRDEVAVAMEVFLSQKWMKVEDRKALLLMWKWYRENMHFVDSFLLALSNVNNYKITTFDKKLEKRSLNDD
jgi:predicted nucleic-acid-binding protein